jgi:hypothetical protein
MGYRSFRDTKGMDWQAWDVIPALADRRLHERRVQRTSIGAERRRATDRRVKVGRRPGLHAGMSDGWLCFEGAEEKRRLSPIPADWLRCAVERLELYLAAAKPAVRLTSPILTGDLSRH